jgi:uncharacterized membrane protein YbhN (UPF0104 family)
MTDADEQILGPTSSWRPWINVAKVALCVAVLIAVGWALVKQFRQIEWSQLHFHLVPLVLAIIALFGVSAMQLAARFTLLLAYGYRPGWRVQLAAAWIPQLGKYLPGGIASVGGAVYLLRKYGVPGAVALSVAVLLDGMAVIAGLICSTPLLLWGPVREKVEQRIPHAWIICLILSALGLIVLHPTIFVGLLNMLLRRTRRQPIAEAPPVRKYLWPTLASFGQWVFAGMALWLMTMSVTNVSPNLIPLFIGSAALAMTISYLMPFSPGGLGIREVLYLITLGPAIGPAAAIVALAMRVFQTIIEVVLAGVGVYVLRGNPVRQKVD